jgi:hypothetical protein
VAGPLLAFFWSGINGHLMGCRDMRRQWIILGLGWIVVTPMNVYSRWLRMTAEPDSLVLLGASLLKSVSGLFVIFVFVLIMDRQNTLYRLQMRNRRSLWGIPTALAVFALSLALRQGLFPDQPLLREVIGGISLVF